MRVGAYFQLPDLFSIFLKFYGLSRVPADEMLVIPAALYVTPRSLTGCPAQVFQDRPFGLEFPTVRQSFFEVCGIPLDKASCLVIIDVNTIP